MKVAHFVEVAIVLLNLARTEAAPAGGEGRQKEICHDLNDVYRPSPPSNPPIDLNEAWKPSPSSSPSMDLNLNQGFMLSQPSSPLLKSNEIMHQTHPEQFVDYFLSSDIPYPDNDGGEASSMKQGAEHIFQEGKDRRSPRYWQHRQEAQQWSLRDWFDLNEEERQRVQKVRQALHNHINQGVRNGESRDNALNTETLEAISNLPTNRIDLANIKYEDIIDPIMKTRYQRARRAREKKEAEKSGIIPEDSILHRGKGRPRLSTEGMTQARLNVLESKRKYMNRRYAEGRAQREEQGSHQ